MPLPYRDFNSYLRETFGERVQKITVDAGLTCPNRDGTVGRGGCTYCNALGSGTGDAALGLSVAEQIRRHRGAVARRYKAKKFLVYFQSYSNTYAPVERLRQLYGEALSATDGIVGLSIGTRPDCVDEPRLALLEELARSHLIWVEYGLQSAHDETLKAIRRGHDLACFERAVAKTRGRGIRICAHVILGLPGEKREHMMTTARTLAGMGVDGVKLHLLYVARGTPLAADYLAGTFRCLDQAEYADLVGEFLSFLPPETIIQRLTGDPHPEELVAPGWSLDKRGTLDLIFQRMTETGIRQGARYVEGESSRPS